MVSAAEGARAKQGIAANLAVGVDTLSGNDSVTFTLYKRLVLPLDGFVFWVKSDLISASALLNISQMNGAQLNEPLNLTHNPTFFHVKGSFHYSTVTNQNESETEGTNTVIFTAEEPVQKFNDVQGDDLWIGTYGGDIEGFDGPIKFAFSSRGNYYKAADLFHYVGTAVLPVFEAQLIDSADQLIGKEVIVSNSLPIWLLLNQYNTPWKDRFSNYIQLYPSFLLPDNLPVPYGAVHIGPDDTDTIQTSPAFGSNLSQASLCVDKVRVTLYGLDNEAALSFLDAVLQYSYDYDTLGMMNQPTIKDEKRVSPELGVIAQKKRIDFEVSYNQGTLRNVVRQMIEKVIPEYLPQPLTAAGYTPAP